ncbi:MAG: ferredoxin-thioredoxin reductase catalytic domain-containing protein [Elusimicrobiota bacterium]
MQVQQKDINKEKVREFVTKYARLSGFKLNPDSAILEIVIEGLARNKEKYGKYYCPCRRVTGNPEEDRKKICPCVWHKDEINQQGHCLCNLYYKG